MLSSSWPQYWTYMSLSGLQLTNRKILFTLKLRFRLCIARWVYILSLRIWPLITTTSSSVKRNTLLDLAEVLIFFTCVINLPFHTDNLLLSPHMWGMTWNWQQHSLRGWFFLNYSYKEHQTVNINWGKEISSKLVIQSFVYEVWDVR